MPREREGIAKECTECAASGQRFRAVCSPPPHRELLGFTSHEQPVSENVEPLGNVQENFRSLAQTSLCRRCGLLGNSKMGVVYGSSGNLRDLDPVGWRVIILVGLGL